MYTLEDDNETSSRIRKQELVGLAETQNLPGDELKARPTRRLPDDELKARPTRRLPDDEMPTSPGTAASENPFYVIEQVEFSEQDATLAGTIPYASPLPITQEEDPTLSILPSDENTLEQSLPDPNALPSTPQAAPSQKPNRRAIAALTIACIGVFFTALDQTVVVTALPKMFPDLQLAYTQIDHAAWIISAYLLGFVVAMPLMGRVSDIYGRRRIFLLCLAIFGLGSIFCGLAPTMANIFDISFLSAIGIDTSSQPLVWLVAARLIQAIGGGAIVPIAMAVASDFYGQEKRGLALGIVGAVTEAGGVVGPVYGAIITEHWGWQAIFYLNAPIVIILFVAGWYFIPRGRRLLQGIDWLGAVLLAGSLTCLSIGLAQQGTSLGPITTTSSSTNNPTALILAAIFLAAFIVVERKVRWPVVDLVSFKRPTFSASSIVSLLIGAALIIAMTDIPIYVDTVLGQSVLQSGLALLRLTVMIPIGAIIGGWLCNRISCRWVGIASLLLTALGFYLMSQWPIAPSEWQITISTVITGLGFGLVIAPIGTTAINSLPPSQAGVGSAIVTALRMVGMTLGLAVLTSWALARFQQLASQYPSLSLKATPAELSAWSKGYAAHVINSLHITYCNVFLISAFICLAALIPAFFLWKRQAPLDEAEEHAHLLYEDEASLTPAILQQRKRKRLKTTGIILLVIFVSIGALAAEWFRENAEYGSQAPLSNILNPKIVKNPSVVSGPRMIQLAVDKEGLTSIFASQLGLQQSVLSDLTATPGPNDGLALSFNLHINLNGIQRVLPVGVDATIGLDRQQNLHLTLQQLKRDGVVADAKTTASMEKALNEMLTSTVMSTFHSQFKGTKLISVHTSTTVTCAQKTEMFVLQVEAPPIEGVAAQPVPVPFCFRGPVDLTKLLPQ